MSEFLDVAIKAAKAGGAIALKYFNEGFEVDHKADGSEVTIADKEAEAKIIEIIKESYPDHAFLGEETGKSGSSKYTWVIDPIDGTRAYARKMVEFGTFVALLEENEVIASAVCMPAMDVLLDAAKGEGCRINGEPALVSDLPFAEANIIHENISSLIRAGIAEKLIPLSSHVRYLGGMPTRLVMKYFFQGKIDGFIIGGVNPWDVMPFGLMTEEAGGKATDLQGKPIGLESTSILCASKENHAKLLAHLN